MQKVFSPTTTNYLPRIDHVKFALTLVTCASFQLPLHCLIVGRSQIGDGNSDKYSLIGRGCTSW